MYCTFLTLEFHDYWKISVAVIVPLSKQARVCLEQRYWCDTVASLQSIHPCMHQPDLVEEFDFVVVNSLLHNQFDNFKKAENTDISYLEMNSLLHFYIRQHPQSGTFLTKKYGKTYLTCTCGQVDELCQWIYDMRKQHPKSKLYIYACVYTACGYKLSSHQY